MTDPTPVWGMVVVMVVCWLLGIQLGYVLFSRMDKPPHPEDPKGDK